jgi:hypothetical protein
MHPSQEIPLSNNQKAELSRVAKVAWQRHVKHGLTEETEKDFRHREALACKGVACRISEAKNRHYNLLLAHFANLAGDSRGALNATLRGQTDAWRQAMHKLEAELKKSNLSRAYAEALCGDAYKCPLEKATATQLRHLTFTVINRRKARREEDAAGS